MKQHNKRWWGIDLGGTKIEIVVCDGASDEVRPIVRRRALTERERGYEAIIDTVAQLVRGVAEELGEAPERVGIGTPGVVDPQTRQLKTATPSASTDGQLKMTLGQRSDAPCGWRTMQTVLPSQRRDTGQGGVGRWCLG